MKILLLVYGDLGERVSGPQIRGLALARTLAQRHDVTVAIGDGEGSVAPGVAVIPATRRAIARAALAHDAFVAPSVPPYVLALKTLAPLLTVSDQYDPVELEQGTLGGRSGAASMRAARRARRLQLRHADVVACANAPQRDALLEELATLDRSGDAPAVVTAPFGLPPSPPASDRRPIRERFPEIGPDDRIVLWWGSVWRWLDAESAIRAVAAIDGAKLVITAGRPRAQADNLVAAEEARALATELGVLGRSVFFIDDWIPYEERHHYLMEADIGLTLHAATPEAPVAARARYMDYLWAGLPCVLARGDELSERFAAAGFAQLVDPFDVAATRERITRALSDERALQRARQAAPALARELGWDAAIRQLEEALATTQAARVRDARASSALLAAVGAEYVRLGRDAIFA